MVQATASATVAVVRRHLDAGWVTSRRLRQTGSGTKARRGRRMRTRMDQPEALRLAVEAFDLWQAGRLPEADARYREALAVADPHHYRTPDIHGQYAGLLTRMRRLSDAGRHFETALQLELQNEPDEASPPVLMARYL